MRYRTIVADPPWHYETFTAGPGSPGRHGQVKKKLPYASMRLSEIAEFPVASLAHTDGANIFLWTTNRYLPSAFKVLSSWGAVYRHTLVWHKAGTNPLTGGIAPTTCEYLLFARLGAGAPITEKWDDSLVSTKRPGPNRHSAKPEGFLDRIESSSPGPYLELFARRQRLGWDTWGDEALQHVELPT